MFYFAELNYCRVYSTPPADVYAVYLSRLQDSPRVAYFLNHLKEYLAQHVDNLVQHRTLR